MGVLRSCDAHRISTLGSSKTGKDILNVVGDKTSGSMLAQAMILALLVSECIAMERPNTRHRVITNGQKVSYSTYQCKGQLVVS